jgi:hypothetical protein
MVYEDFRALAYGIFKKTGSGIRHIQVGNMPICMIHSYIPSFLPEHAANIIFE